MKSNTVTAEASNHRSALMQLINLCNEAPSSVDKEIIAEVITDFAYTVLADRDGEQVLAAHINSTQEPYVASALRSALHR